MSPTLVTIPLFINVLSYLFFEQVWYIVYLHLQVINEAHLPGKKNVRPDIIQSHTLMGTDITCKKGSQVAGLNFETATNFLKVYSILACTDVSEQARRVCGK